MQLFLNLRCVRNYLVYKIKFEYTSGFVTLGLLNICICYSWNSEQASDEVWMTWGLPKLLVRSR
jgi:hypothetical protein